MKNNKRTVNIVLILGVLVFGFISFKFFSSHPRTKIENLGQPPAMVKESLASVESKLPEMIADYGIEKVLAWVREGFASKQITMFECHTLTHVIGHRALNYYKDDINAALKDKQLQECEGGYVHGVEAQAVEQGGDYKLKLFEICEILLKGKSFGGCYHGAGHAFMRPDGTPQHALEYCNNLYEGPAKDLDSCYNGVFSEYTNLIGGMDGHTGLPLSAGPPFKLETTAIKFCSGFEEKYQVPCSLEVNGFGFGPGKKLEQIEASMRECTQPAYKRNLQIACLQSMAAVSAQHELPVNELKPPIFILSLDLPLRQAYITGAASEMKAFIDNGQEKDWQGFCKTFLNNADESFCNGFFK